MSFAIYKKVFQKVAEEVVEQKKSTANKQHEQQLQQIRDDGLQRMFELGKEAGAQDARFEAVIAESRCVLSQLDQLNSSYPINVFNPDDAAVYPAIYKEAA